MSGRSPDELAREVRHRTEALIEAINVGEPWQVSAAQSAYDAALAELQAQAEAGQRAQATLGVVLSFARRGDVEAAERHIAEHGLVNADFVPLAAAAPSPADRPMTEDESVAYIRDGTRPSDTRIPDSETWARAVERCIAEGVLGESHRRAAAVPSPADQEEA